MKRPGGPPSALGQQEQGPEVSVSQRRAGTGGCCSTMVLPPKSTASSSAIGGSSATGVDRGGLDSAWQELLSDPGLLVVPNSVPGLPLPHQADTDSLAIPGGSLIIKKHVLTGIKEMLVAQKSMQQELERRWCIAMQRDAELLDGFKTPAWDQMMLSPAWQTDDRAKVEVLLKEKLNESLLLEQKDLTQSRKDVEVKVVADQADAQGAAQALQVGQEENRLMERQNSALFGQAEHLGSRLWEEPSVYAEAIEKDMSAPTSESLASRKSKLIDLAESLQREREKADSLKNAPEVWWVKIVNSNRFDLGVGCIIILNTFVMLVHVELQGFHIREEIFCNDSGCAASEEPGFEDAFTFLEHMFTTVFLLEMILRLVANGFRFLKSLMHLGDCAIVMISVIDIWVLAPLGGDSSSGMAVLRIARLAKLAKVFRVVRVLRAFKPLRILVSTIAHSVGALAWSMTLLFVFELIGSIFLAQLLQPFLKDATNDLEMRRKVWTSFGTWTRAMYTAFEITMAPGGFIQYREVIENTTPMVGLFFVIYGCVVTFAVIRVITALFLRATLAACDSDDDYDAHLVMLGRNAFAEMLQASIDEDGSGGIDIQEFSTLIHIPQMKEWLADSDLSVAGAHRLCLALTNPETGEMNFEEFLRTLTMMRGPARSADLIVVSCETRKVLDQTTVLVESLEKALHHLGEPRTPHTAGPHTPHCL